MSGSTLSPTPLLQSKSSPGPNQTFIPLRPPISTTPTRDGRSRSANNALPTSTPTPKLDTLTYDNFNDIMTQKIQDPLFTDHLARLNRITTSISQHVSTLTNYSEKLSDLDTRQKSLLEDIEKAKMTLEGEAHIRLNKAIPEIEMQNRTMDNMEKRVDTARLKLAHQVEMLSDIDFKIAENRRLMALPPPSSRHINSPPLHSRESSGNSGLERSDSYSSQTPDRPEPKPTWNCTIT